MEYDKIEPIGAVRDDLRTAFLGLRLAQALNVENPKLEQFLLDFDTNEEVVGSKEDTLLEKAKYLQSLFAAQGMPAFVGPT